MKPSSILIIDDEKVVRDSFGAHLEDCGYDILTAKNGRVGLMLYEKEQPDLVLVDLRMPEVDGMQVLEQICHGSPLTPLIVVSGTGIIGDAIEALHHGAWDYLLKPIEDLSILTHAVETALEKGRLKRENRDYREHLERLVAERTVELEQANTRLTDINTRLKNIVDTTRALSCCNEVQEFGSLLLEAFGSHMLATGGSIYLKEEDGLRLVHAMDAGHAADFIPFPLPENSVFQLTIAENQPALVDMANQNGRVIPSGWQGYADGSALVFPLLDEFGGIAGIVTLHSKTPPPFVEQDREIGTILASYGCETLRALRATEGLHDSEAQLRQAQKMEALGTLASGIAHDFNNILSAVLGYSELGLQDLDDPAHPLHVKFKAINHAGLRARDLVEQILAFSRMQEQLHAPVKISSIVKEAIKLLQSSLPANIDIQMDIKADQPVLGDPTQIHQIIMNLCTNAYHAMQESGGVLGVSLEQAALDTPTACRSLDLFPGEYLQLTVSDTGTGISPAIINRIFDPYFTTKDKSKGTGLGLAVVHGIVKRHGGGVAVDSRVGKGTRLSVFLPVSSDETVESSIHTADLPKGTEHVLLVDDEKDIVEIGYQMLRRLGYRVTALTESTDALEIFKQNPFRFDLVVTDFNMPGLTGDQMARQMLDIRRDTPIIVCTGFSEVFNRQRAQAIGIRQTLMKPVTMETIAHAMREVLDER